MMATSTPHNPELRIIDSEGDLVGVHSEVPFRMVRGVLRSSVCVAMTHMSHAFLGTSSQVLHVSGSNVYVFLEATRWPVLGPRGVQTWPGNGANITRLGDSARTVATVAKHWGVAA